MMLSFSHGLLKFIAEGFFFDAQTECIQTPTNQILCIVQSFTNKPNKVEIIVNEHPKSFEAGIPSIVYK